MRDGRTGDDGVQHLRQCLRAEAQQPSLILVDIDPDHAGRLHPVEIDVPRVRIARHDAGKPQRDVTHLRYIRTADTILDRPTDRRPKSERRHARHRAGELRGEHLLEPHLKPLARRHVLGDDNRLGEEIVGQFHRERQIEANCAATNIGAPARDVGIRLQHIIESRREAIGCVDGGILRQPEIDEQLRTIGWRKELPWYERR